MSLKSDFQQRNQFFSNRSSAIFPVMIKKNLNVDTLIVYMDYWKIKSNIENVVLNLRIYDQDGQLHVRQAFSVSALHNQLRVSDLIETDEFSGMVEVEFVSTENIRFSFPGIVTFYQAGDLYSVVHSAGRVKNCDEAQIKRKFRETNWTCKFSENITPFFHLFIGANVHDLDEVTVNIHDGENGGEIVDSIKIANPFSKPFSSRIFYLDELLDCKSYRSEDTYFASVDVEVGSIFPRLVVGNFHRQEHFHEVTHSFPWQYGDDCVNPEGVDSWKFLSFLPMVCGNELSLDMISFPTNFSQSVSAELYQSSRSEKKCVSWKTGGEQSNMFRFQANSDEFFKVLCFSEGKIPSRLNSNFRYQVKNTATAYSTDIATGAKSLVYPPKYRHWGYGLAGNGYKTVLLMRNFSHKKKCHACSGTIDIYLNDNKYSVDIELAADDAKEIDISDYILDKPQADVVSFSWFMTLNEPTVEAFWLSYSNDGRICGEHAF